VGKYSVSSHFSTVQVDVFFIVALTAGMERCSFCSIYTKTDHYFTENDCL